MVHTSWLRVFRPQGNEDGGCCSIRFLAATNLDEFYVESIVDHEGEGKDPKKLKFRVPWLRYDKPEDDT